MAYAAFNDVVARAGRFAGLFTVEGKHPDQADVESIIENVSDEIDAAISAAGFSPAQVGDTVRQALVDVTAAGALARALPAANPGPAAAPIIAEARDTFETAIVAIIARTFPAIAALEAGAGEAAGPSAGSWWDEAEAQPLADPLQTGWPDKGRRAVDLDPAEPAFRRGQAL